MKTPFLMLYRSCPINTIKSDEGRLLGFAIRFAGKWYGYPRHPFLDLGEAKRFVDSKIDRDLYDLPYVLARISRGRATRNKK